MNSIDSNNFRILKKIKSQSNYKARTWDKEDAFRYIFSIDDNILEGAFFIHYQNDEIVKYVVELPISYGCPIECKHCASGAINKVKQLGFIDIIDMFIFIVSDNKIPPESPVLVTYSGIGEGALQKKNIAEASKIIFEKYKKSYFNLSTVGYDPTFIDFCDNLSKSIPVHHIQITYLHYSLLKLKEIIPNAEKLKFDFDKLNEAIFNSQSKTARFNYILINDYNDDLDHLGKFLDKIEFIKDKVVVRISKLNDTDISRENGFTQPAYEKLEIFYNETKNRGFKTHIFTPETNNNMNCGQLSWDYINNDISTLEKVSL